MNLGASIRIARTVLLEAVRRREIYLLVLVSTLLVGAIPAIDFFHLKGFSKFYRETALGVMGLATALMVVVLAARQLPREFAQRTLYPLLARPVSRFDFLLGKLLGVMAAALFCLALFSAVFCAGTLWFEGSVPVALLAQHMVLQAELLLVLACLSFLLSMICTLDAAITIAVIFHLAAAMMMNLTTHLHATGGAGARVAAQVLTWALPQLELFDLSEKVVHGARWEPLSFGLMAGLSAYALAYASVYFGLALLAFRRKPL